ncbi:MAG: hypothetical protein LBE65_01760, partial [Synergistaceae bacterium]|nr:hypothetical protein [Synergistaceae bacterium]
MWKNKLYSFLLIMMLGVSTVTDSSIGAGGCGGNDTPIMEEEPIPIPDPEGNWMDDGNYDTTWYYNGENELSTAKQLA